jgi:hypothetical protein
MKNVLLPLLLMATTMCTSAAVAKRAGQIHGPVLDAPFAATHKRAVQSAVCVNGYRITHVVRSQGRSSPGVILRCRS